MSLVRHGTYPLIYISAYLGRWLGSSSEVGESARSVDFLCSEMLADVLKHLRLTVGELDECADDFHLGTAEVVGNVSEASVLPFAEIS